MDECRVQGCAKPIKIKKWELCGTHYNRWKVHGDPTAWKKPTRQVCSVDGCAFRCAARGVCDLHYRRIKRYGTTDLPERPTVCVTDGCELPAVSNARCDRHYRRARKGLVGERDCARCGKMIDPNVSLRRLFCSPECKEIEYAVRRKASHRAIWLRRYGLTEDQYAARLAAQGGGCGLCGTSILPSRGSFLVDHGHASGTIRGILCTKCNTGLGMFRDDPRLLRKAADYLERNPDVARIAPL